MSLADFKIYCGHQDYLSHARAASDYRAILTALCQVVDDPEVADAALLHHEPTEYNRLLEELPALRNKYLIGYCVWESDRLPPQVQAGASLMDELWTASAYCHAVFAKYHPRVVWVPHVVRSLGVASREAETTVRTKLRIADDHFNFLHITTEGIKRKNTDGLRQAFTYVARRAPQARLIIKTITYPRFSLAIPQVQHHDAVTVVDGKLTASEMAALYRLSHVLVSPHRAEGWGLTLSDAMLEGIPVVATAYSGNMDFMTPYNSWWVSFTEENIRDKDVYNLFNKTMRWATPHRESLERQMLSAMHMVQDGSSRPITEQAQRDMAVYDSEHITNLLRGRMQDLAAGLRTHAVQPMRRVRRRLL